jgi:hypothetical protein
MQRLKALAIEILCASTFAALLCWMLLIACDTSTMN